MAGGGGKAEEPGPHPPKDQLPNVSYCITSPPPWPEAILLGFQHFIVMLATTVIIPTALVPQMGGRNEEKAKVIQTLLLVAGINTLLQTTFGTRLPAVIGGSYTFVAPTISIILSGRWSDQDPVARFKKIMRAVQGALIIASTLQIVLGFSGLWRNVTRFLSPLSAVPLVALTGFGLYEFGFPGVAKCVEIGMPELIILIIFSQYLPHVIKPGKHIFDRFAVLFSVVIVWIYAHLLTVGGAYNGTSPSTQTSCRTDRAGLIGGAPWIRVPYPFQWGAPSFVSVISVFFMTMRQGDGDYTSLSTPTPSSLSYNYQYPQNPNPNSIPNPPPPPLADTNTLYGAPYASAPPFSDHNNNNYSPYPSNYPPFPQNTDHVPSLSYSPNPNSQPQYNPPQPSFPQFENHVPYQSQSYYPPSDQPQFEAHVPYQSQSYYESGVNLDQSGEFGNSGLGRCDSGGGGYGEGVYAYQGSKTEPYGARGTGSKSSTWSSGSPSFDDFGRPISFPSGKTESSVSTGKIARAVPKVESEQDSKGGVQKFRVKLLAESGGQNNMDVLCQIGLDGIRMLDPSTSRTLRIYPLDTVTRCDVTDSSTFAFWSKSSVDIEPRRIRLQSNRYTTNTILDTVTAATVQLKEMGGGSRPSDSLKVSDQPSEKKKGLGDWMNLMKPVNEEKDHWVPDEAVTKCTACGSDFGAFVRRHHCRNCGDIFCDKCTQGRIALTADENAPQVRVCDRCLAEVTHRLSNAKDAATRSAAVESHEDLAKKLQEEMERNRKSSSGPKSDSSGRHMKEVACPTCTVHLQVQVPSSGSETIECGVCQHPFLVSAH